MNKKFFLPWVSVYLVNSLLGFLIHHVLLGPDYRELAGTLQSTAKDRIPFFILSSIISTFFLTLIYVGWRKKGSMGEAMLYGFFIGLWMGSNMGLNTYASSDLIPLSLSLKWVLLVSTQYTLDGLFLGLINKIASRQSI